MSTEAKATPSATAEAARAAYASAANWAGGDFTKQDLTVELTPAHVAALERLAQQARTQGLTLRELEKQHFADPAIDDFSSGLFHRLRNGPGMIVIRGFPVNRQDFKDLEYIYMGLGTHFGLTCSQSSAGDVLGYVTDRQSARGYASNRELALHVDPAEVVGLLCVRKARQGGENVYASAIRIHQIIQQEHPEYLPVLERGFPYHRRGEEAEGQDPITPYNVPVFSACDGVLSCRYSREVFDTALRDLGRKMTPLEAAAVAFFEDVGMRPGVRFEMSLEPGEAAFINNFAMLHARTPYVDWDEAERKRLLLRLWCVGVPPRPVRGEINHFENGSGRQGIDGQPGRMPGLAKYAPPDSSNKAILRR